MAAVTTEPDNICSPQNWKLRGDQRKDPDICSRFPVTFGFPESKSPQFCDNILYYIDPKPTHRKRIVLPKHLTKSLLKKTHRNRMARHFSGQRTTCQKLVVGWWEGMYSKFVLSCLIVRGSGRTPDPCIPTIPSHRS